MMPVAVLALGWGTRLVLFEVPLVGDHVTAGEAAAGEDDFAGSVGVVMEWRCDVLTQPLKPVKTRTC